MSQILPWYPGKCTTTITSSPEQLLLESKTGAKRSLREIVEATTPVCSLNPLLFNGHLQTFWTARKVPGPFVHYKRRVFEQVDPAFKGHFCIDYVVAPPPLAETPARDGGVEDQGLREDPVGLGHHRLPPRTTYFTNKEWENIGSNDSKPLLIVLHGLSGGSYEIYLREVIAPLVAASEQGRKAGGLSGGDWEALVVNSRGCAGAKVSTNMLYNARATWDVRQVIDWARETWPNRPLFGIGFSLGANILTNYLGDEGAGCLLSAAIIVANPWNLEVTSNALKRTYIGLHLYHRTLGVAMRTIFERHKDKILENELITAEKMRSIKYLYEFDREYQTKTFGYPTEDAYYRDASSVDSLLAIRVPTLCLHAQDDPIAADEAVPYKEIEKNPYVVMAATSGGGHLGWFEPGGSRWHVKPATGFLNAMKDIDLSKTVAPDMTPKSTRNGVPSPFQFDPVRIKNRLRDAA